MSQGCREKISTAKNGTFLIISGIRTASTNIKETEAQLVKGEDEIIMADTEMQLKKEQLTKHKI